ncbi:NAD(P)/FAD-dependent oxidoreductase [Massilia sp. CCM 8695]|uniref:NAD(P)/FAD-dependent oxidoreductase n=1 Tax=Massilia frigida TaxID=2609281 RepID=A0ABX0NFA2_9BURK|nr:tryptophan 7-halogenase [Massilia frigida]NHZ81202.1 NAD(P)/FAD-dependent oxidoreductase [Massilia frigida]
MTGPERCDVAVLGAGPAGCATALALARNTAWRIRLIDPGVAPGPRVGETLLPDTRLVLEQLGVLDAFLEQGHASCLGSCSAWGSAILGFNDFLLSPNALGWHLDRRRFDAFLLDHAAARPQVRCLPSRFEACAPLAGGGFALRLADRQGSGAVLEARIVVDATGQRAAFARRAGARQQYLDRLMFVYGFFDTGAASSSARLTVLEAAQSGWWYAAQLPDARLAVACATDPDLLRRDGLGGDDAWLARVLATGHIAARLDGCRFLRGSLSIRPALSGMLDTVAGAHWLAVGDAAAVYDPLAAQGIHKALSDGLRAAAAIDAALGADGVLAPGYGSGAAERFEQYRTNRNYFYGLERRWERDTFWQRRHARTELQPARGH